MKYLLDGYNILFRDEDASVSLEEQRIRLFEKLNFLAEASHFNFIVVLDAHMQAGELERHHYHSLEIIYTNFDQTADDYIIDYVECLLLNKRNRIKVVSSDRALIQKVRLERVEVLSVPGFFKEMDRKVRLRSSKKKHHQSKVHSKVEKSFLPHLDDTASWIAIFEARCNPMDDGVL